MNSIERKCISCVHGVLDGRVKCLHQWHPGVVGGWGTEWVSYCHEYRKDTRGEKTVEKRIVYNHAGDTP